MKKLLILATLSLSACQNMSQQEVQAKRVAETPTRDDVVNACVNTTKYQIKCAPVVKNERGVELQFCSSGNYAVDQGLWKQMQADLTEEAGYFEQSAGVGDPVKNPRINVQSVDSALLSGTTAFGYAADQLVGFTSKGGYYAGILVFATDKERVFLNDKCQ